MPARRIAVVGLGVISKFYLDAIRRLPQWELAAVCDIREATLAPHLASVPCYRDLRAMLREIELDGLIVTVPNDAHGKVCRAALARGIPVCTEKPLAVSLNEGRELDRLARQHEVPLFTAFHRRYNDNVLGLLRNLPRDDEIESLTVHYLERIEEHIGQDTWYLDPQRCGGGCVADNGPNAFDLVRLLLGDVEVTDAQIVRDKQGTDRQAIVDLRTGTGRPARVELDWSYPGEVKDIEVHLTTGVVLRADMLAHHPGFKASLWHEYVGILEDFAAAVSTGVCGAVDGLAALELVAASYRNETTRTALERM
jgi:predicted dehydrogenase